MRATGRVFVEAKAGTVPVHKLVAVQRWVARVGRKLGRRWPCCCAAPLADQLPLLPRELRLRIATAPVASSSTLPYISIQSSLNELWRALSGWSVGVGHGHVELSDQIRSAATAPAADHYQMSAAASQQQVGEVASANCSMSVSALRPLSPRSLHPLIHPRQPSSQLPTTIGSHHTHRPYSARQQLAAPSTPTANPLPLASFVLSSMSILSIIALVVRLAPFPLSNDGDDAVSAHNPQITARNNEAVSPAAASAYDKPSGPVVLFSRLPAEVLALLILRPTFDFQEAMDLRPVERALKQWRRSAQWSGWRAAFQPV